MAQANCPECGQPMLSTSQGAWCSSCHTRAHSNNPSDANTAANYAHRAASEREFPVLMLVVTVYRVLAVVVGVVGCILALVSFQAGLLSFMMSAMWTVAAATGLIAISEAIMLAIRIEQNTFATRQLLERYAKPEA